MTVSITFETLLQVAGLIVTFIYYVWVLAFKLPEELYTKKSFFIALIPFMDWIIDIFNNVKKLK